jgi:hypothetical protein
MSSRSDIPVDSGMWWVAGEFECCVSVCQCGISIVGILARCICPDCKRMCVVGSECAIIGVLPLPRE